MTIKQSLWAAFFLAAALSVQGAGTAQPQRPLENPGEWLQLDGGQRSFTFRDGELHTGRSDSEPSAIFTRDDFENFVISFDFMVSRWGQSGLYFHAPRIHQTRAALKFQLSDNRGGPPPPYRAGSLFRRVPPIADAIHEHGEWNACTIRVEWPHLHATLNGVVVQDLDLSTHPETRHSLRRGAIGFQNDGTTTRIRNLEITPLPDSLDHETLFDGHSLDGWEVVRGNATWSLKDGAILAEDGDGYLRHERLAQDFRLHLLYRTSPGANGGVFFRWPAQEPATGADRGQEIQIYDVPEAIMPSGSIYGIERGYDLALRPGQWNLLQVHVQGKHATTLLNGIPCASTEALALVRPGHICLQMHSRGAWIEYKDIVLIVND